MNSVDGHLQIHGLAGHAVVAIMAHLPGIGCTPLMGVRLTPAEARRAARDLTAIAADELTPPPVLLIRRDPHSHLWGFTCHDHPGPPVRASFHDHPAAVKGADRHLRDSHKTPQETTP